ncbi:recombinase family protein [Novosphingobium sp. 9U]|uniref:recombinase family protein n=1 Tax=Novosphingobium sp. 9U TaxID=2653158 RepID=UPI00352C2F69
MHVTSRAKRDRRSPMLVGYARVSSVGQSLDLQVQALKDAGCQKVYQEKRSGKSGTERPELTKALDQAREGDTLVVTRLDRLARSVGDLHAIMGRLTAEGVSFRCLQQGGVDTSSSTGKLMLAILGAVAEFENDIRRERQKDGIEKAKAQGVYKGRPATIDAAKVQALKASGMGAAAIAREMGIGRASVYRVLQDA